jgi:hypothetical protein
MNHLVGTVRQGIPDGVDVDLLASCQSDDGGALHGGADALDRIKLDRGRNRKSGLYSIHAQTIEGFSHFNFLFNGH